MRVKQIISENTISFYNNKNINQDADKQVSIGNFYQKILLKL